MNYEYIPDLIKKYLLGTISESELSELDAWKAESEDNEQLFKRLCDDETITSAYSSWTLINRNSAMAAMKSRLNKEHRPKRIAIAVAAAAMAAFAFATLGISLYNSEQKYDNLYSEYHSVKCAKAIVPGTTQATLTTEEGKVIVLGEDQASNDEAIRIASKKAKKAISYASDADRTALNNLSIPRGGEFHIVLEDGTEVWLNAESSLKYPEHFNGNTREVETSGEVYFKVAKDESRPFYVRTAGQIVKVYGTEFNILSYDDDRYVYTTLVNGSISLMPDGSETTELILTPGHQSIFEKSSSTAKIQQVKADVITSWRNGMFVFEDQTLEQIMKQLSRWYNFEYSFANQQAAQTIFMGRIPRYSRFGDVLDIFEKSGNLKFSVNGNTVMISTNNLNK